MNAKLLFCAAAACALLIGCQHHRYGEEHGEGRSGPVVRTPGLCTGAQCNVDVTVKCSTGPRCIHPEPDTLVVTGGAEHQPVIHIRMATPGREFSRVEFDPPQAQFLCTPGPTVVTCVDKHSSSGVFKYTIAVKDVAGPPLDPFVVNN